MAVAGCAIFFLDNQRELAGEIFWAHGSVSVVSSVCRKICFFITLLVNEIKNRASCRGGSNESESSFSIYFNNEPVLPKIVICLLPTCFPLVSNWKFEPAIAPPGVFTPNHLQVVSTMGSLRRRRWPPRRMKHKKRRLILALRGQSYTLMQFQPNISENKISTATYFPSVQYMYM